MKDDRCIRIDELKVVQRQKQFIQMLESKNYPPHQLIASNADEEIWNKINQGGVIERIEELSLETLRRQMGQIFSASEKLGTVLYFGTDSFLVQFNKSELIQHADKMIEDLSRGVLLHWFVFSIDLNQILLLEESEYGYYELTYYEKNI
ncbi:hypothetical protein QL992_04485 [Microbacterium sp. APC 3898]|uniref:Uncharacterized protein n=2 Tax=Planococcus TaxID=1372 RepID=A0ABT7ZLH4_9BACL|nr:MULTISPECIES: hypothetical protein [Terrabacteria group]MBD8015023.1 hypothetical protein [Planococcus wigleyi]MDN3428005.1 hypothetical protein [Planococcus sp. APC 4016]MDN3498460.1 hypothetical protein [Microbacterium sp. APC 3898]